MIVALQYYEGDRERTLSLARLLADIEPVPRNDILLALVCQPNTPPSELTDLALKHCSLKFPVTHVVSTRGAHGHPEGCGQLWAGTMNHFSDLFESKATPHNSIFTLDGGDGIPLHRNWITMLKEEHAKTLALEKLITGTPYNQGGCPVHVNPNAVFHLSIWKKTPSLHNIPKYDGTLLTNFDIYHRRTMLNNASLSSIVRTDWRGAGNHLSLELMKTRAKPSVWLHGYKDNNLYEVARKHLLTSETIPLKLERYQLTNLYLMESCKRPFV